MFTSRSVLAGLLAGVLLGAALGYLALRFVVWPQWGGAGFDVCGVAAVVGLILLVGGLTFAVARRWPGRSGRLRGSVTTRKDDMKKAIVILFFLLLVACSGSNDALPTLAPTAKPIEATPEPATPEPATLDPWSMYKDVHNDCGPCGTNSPVGGWETASGASLVLSDDGNYVAFSTNGSMSRGRWQQTGSQLCLSSPPARVVCSDYEQKIDAMKLGNFIYIRR